MIITTDTAADYWMQYAKRLRAHAAKLRQRRDETLVVDEESACNRAGRHYAAMAFETAAQLADEYFDVFAGAGECAA